VNPKTNFNRIVHFIPPAYVPPVVQEFVEPNPSDHFIHWLYRYRCAECKQPGQEINEIVPRSRSKESIMDWKNRILLCRHCHSMYHNNGVTDVKINAMRTVRKEYLLSIGRKEYI